MDAYFTIVCPENPFHRVTLAEAYQWARQRPDAYLEGTGYESRENFYEPPAGAREFFLMINGLPVALLTFIGLANGAYQVGLITSPKARLRRLMAALRQALRFLSTCGVRELWVRLPPGDCFDGARNLAARLGFVLVGETDWKLEITDGNTRE